MSDLADDLLTQSMQLSSEQRRELAVRILETLEEDPAEFPEDVQEAWLKECERRLAESDSGVPGIPAEEVWRRLDARGAANAAR